jgi:hypothetical protein
MESKQAAILYMERDGNVFRYRVRSVLETVMLEVTRIFLIFLAAMFLAGRPPTTRLA